MPATTFAQLQAQIDAVLKRPAVERDVTQIRVRRQPSASPLATVTGDVYFEDGRYLNVRCSMRIEPGDTDESIRPEPSGDPCGRRLSFRRASAEEPLALGQSRDLLRIEDEPAGGHGELHFHHLDEKHPCCSSRFFWVEVQAVAGGPATQEFWVADALEAILAAYYEHGDLFCRQFARMGYVTRAGRPLL